MTGPERPLGMRKPKDDRHRALYPLTAGTMPDTPTPVVLGINWYRAFDTPQLRNGNSWIGHQSDWGPLRGGHAICVKPPQLIDSTAWWEFFDQGSEGACVGFSVSRMMTLLNRKRYDAMALYAEARRVDDWPGEDYSGTSVRAGCDVARKTGMWISHAGTISGPLLGEGIDQNRWALSVSEIAVCLSPSDAGATVMNAGYVTLLNSWGRFGYPHFVRLPLDALQRLVFQEDGEATVVVDRR